MQDDQNNQFPPQNTPQTYPDGAQPTQNVEQPPVNPQPPVTPEQPINPQPPVNPQLESPKSKILPIIIILIIAIVAIAAAAIVIVINANNQGKAPEEENYSYSGQGDDNYDYRSDKEKENSKKVLAKCDSAQNCIENLDNGEGITVEQYNAAIGFDGTLDPEADNSEYNKTYIWEFSNGDKLLATFSSYGKADIEVNYNYAEHLNTAINLDGYDTIQSEIEHGVTYDEFKAALGNIDGLLTKRWGYNNDRDYIWIGSSAARYIKASVDEHNIVTFVSGIK